MTRLPLCLAALAAFCSAGSPPACYAAEPVSKKYAVLVGVNGYQHEKLSRLAYAEADVTALGAILEQSGYRVTLLTGSSADERAPTKANVERQLKRVLAGCKRGDMVLVALAGHGLQFEGEKDCYFCPVDARPFRDRADSLVSLSGVYKELDASFAGMKVLLVDACRNDPEAGRGARGGIDADNAPRPPQGVAALFSCSAGERAFESATVGHGVFFYHVLAGLRGDATDRKGLVTLGGLASYVSLEVTKGEKGVGKLIGGGARQSPNLKADYSTEPVLAAIEPLFNGKDLTGWVVDHGARGAWSVDGGELVVAGAREIDERGWLLTEKEYSDFTLRFEYRLGDGANSGVTVRAVPGESRYSPTATRHMEIQLLDDNAPSLAGSLKRTQMTGSLHNLALDGPARLKPTGEWNAVEIRASGRSLRIVVNGQATLDTDLDRFADQADRLPGLKRPSGRIGFQNWEGTARFRNIEVRPH